MTRLLGFAVLAAVIGLVPASAYAWDFEYHGDGGAMNGDVAFYALEPMLGDVAFIEELQLEITGLTHQNPDALDVYLIDPFGNSVDVMTDKADSTAVDAITLYFQDDAAMPVPVGDPLVGGMYQTDGGNEMGTDYGLGSYYGQTGGYDSWILVLINDVPVSGDNGIESWHLRGTVPEPATLSLLALGGLAMLRRKR